MDARGKKKSLKVRGKTLTIARFKKIAKRSHELRDICVVTITNLMCESIEPWIPLLHNIFCYCLLKLEEREKVATVRRLLAVALAQLEDKLRREYSSEQDYIVSALGMVSNALFNIPTFKIVFQFPNRGLTEEEITKNSYSPFSLTNITSPRVDLKSGRLSSAGTRAAMTSPASPKDALHRPSSSSGGGGGGGGSPSRQTSNQYEHVRELNVIDFLKLLKELCETVDVEIVEKWGQELLSWICEENDRILSARALQMYSIVLHPMSLAIFVRLLTSLQGSVQAMEKVVFHALKAQEAQERSAKTLASQEETIAQLRNKVIEFLVLFQRMVPDLIADQLGAEESYAILSLMFWTSVALLKPNHAYFSSIWNHALTLLYVLAKNHVLSEEKLSKFGLIDRLRRQAAGASGAFEGCQPLLIPGLLNASTVKMSGEILTTLMVLPAEFSDLVSTSDNSNVVAVIAVLPMLYNLCAVKSRKHTALHNIAVAMAVGLEKSGSPLAETCRLLREVGGSTYKASADALLAGVCDEIHAQYFPHCAKDIAETLGMMLRDGPTTVATAVFNIANNFLLRDGSIAYVHHFVGVLQMASDKVGLNFESSLALLTRASVFFAGTKSGLFSNEIMQSLQYSSYNLSYSSNFLGRMLADKSAPSPAGASSKRDSLKKKKSSLRGGTNIQVTAVSSRYHEGRRGSTADAAPSAGKPSSLGSNQGSTGRKQRAESRPPIPMFALESHDTEGSTQDDMSSDMTLVVKQEGDGESSDELDYTFTDVDMMSSDDDVDDPLSIMSGFEPDADDDGAGDDPYSDNDSLVNYGANTAFSAHTSSGSLNREISADKTTAEVDDADSLAAVTTDEDSLAAHSDDDSLALGDGDGDGVSPDDDSVDGDEAAGGGPSLRSIITDADKNQFFSDYLAAKASRRHQALLAFYSACRAYEAAPSYKAAQGVLAQCLAPNGSLDSSADGSGAGKDAEPRAGGALFNGDVAATMARIRDTLDDATGGDGSAAPDRALFRPLQAEAYAQLAADHHREFLASEYALYMMASEIDLD